MLLFSLYSLDYIIIYHIPLILLKNVFSLALNFWYSQERGIRRPLYEAQFSVRVSDFPRSRSMHHTPLLPVV